MDHMSTCHVANFFRSFLNLVQTNQTSLISRAPPATHIGVAGHWKGVMYQSPIIRIVVNVLVVVLVVVVDHFDVF